MDDSLFVRRRHGIGDLDRHLATQVGVIGLVDRTHPFLAKLGNDAAVGEGLADHGPHSILESGLSSSMVDGTRSVP